MMRKLQLALILLPLILGSSDIHAEVVEVPLPDLHGMYCISDVVTLEATVRTTSIQLERLPLKVHGAWIRLSGTSSVGEFMCFPELGEGPYPWAYPFDAMMEDTISGGFWYAFDFAPDQSGPFEMTSEFHGILGATWDFLKDGCAEIKLTGSIGFVGMCWGTIAPSAIVEDAVFVLDADFQVPTDETSWGRIKALYR